MKKVFSSIGKGIINGFPLIQSIITNVKGVKQSASTIGDSDNPPVKKSFDIISILTELSIVILITCFISGKISVHDLENLINTIKK